MNTNFQNPFDGIMGEMNALKANYERGMGELQQRLNMARQAASQMFQAPMNYQQQPAQQPVAQPPATPAQEAPPQIQHLTVFAGCFRY